MQSSPSLTTISRINHPRARAVLAFVSALVLSLLFAVSHATAAIHAKAKPHKAHKAAVTRKAHAKTKAKPHARKKHSRNVSSTLGKRPKPNHTTNSGAIAIFGMS